MLETALVLIRLAISNLATIRKLSIEFEEGFTVLTGETGAGKSVMIDALRFALGGKASPFSVREGSNHSSVEAVFDVSRSPRIMAELDKLELGGSGELVLRRLLYANGRTRSLMNESTVSQATLETLSRELVNIHGQHDNQALLRPESHLIFLDALAGLNTLREEVAECFRRYTGLQRKQQTQRERQSANMLRDRELREILEEIQSSNPLPGEDSELLRECQVLAHAEQLLGTIGHVREELYEREQSIVSEVQALGQRLAGAAEIDQSLEPTAAQLHSLGLQLEDTYQTLRGYSAGLEADPQRLNWVNTRLAELEKLKRRFGGGIPAVLETYEAGRLELSALEQSAQDESGLAAEIRTVAAQLHALSQKLSEQRRKARGRFEAGVLGHMKDLGMEQAQFVSQIQALSAPTGKTPYYTAQGADQVEFLLSANPGHAPRPLAHIASGGELSRIMLALKTVLAATDSTPTLIFDEVDQGISGSIAEKTGNKLRALAGTHQVVCITHLPQIAAMGHHHLLVEKFQENDGAETRINPLNPEQQVREVARLLSGLTVSGHSLASAQEMVNKAKNPG